MTLHKLKSLETFGGLMVTILRPIENKSNSTSNSTSEQPIPEQVMRLLGVLEGETSPRSIGWQGIG